MNDRFAELENDVKPKTPADAPDPTYPFIPSKKRKLALDLEGIELPDVEITVQGRTFRPAKRTTIAQDMYARKMLKVAGLETFVQHINLRTFDLDELAEEIILTAYETGVLFNVLAGLLVEDGVQWTRERAEETALFFEQVSDPDDKNALLQPIAGVVLSFFVNAIGSIETSETVSLTPQSQGPEAQPPGTSDDSDRNRSEMTTSESGPTSFESAPVMIPIRSVES
jgi:hypothetical protein